MAMKDRDSAERNSKQCKFKGNAKNGAYQTDDDCAGEKCALFREQPDRYAFHAPPAKGNDYRRLTRRIWQDASFDFVAQKRESIFLGKSIAFIFAGMLGLALSACGSFAPFAPFHV